MAAGDIFQTFDTDVTTGAYFNIQPSSGEVVIHNVYIIEGDAVQYEYFNGSTSIAFDSDDVDGARYNLNWHVSTGVYVRVRNDTTSTGKQMAADGIFTK